MADQAKRKRDDTAAPFHPGSSEDADDATTERFVEAFKSKRRRLGKLGRADIKIKITLHMYVTYVVS